MKHTLRSILCVIAASLYSTATFAAVGDTFWSSTDADGQDIGTSMRFSVLTESGTTGTVRLYASSPTSPAISKTYDGVIDVPETVTDNGITYTVTQIGTNSFRDCAITSISFPSTITSWGEAAFQDCSSLTKVTVPSLNMWLESTFSTNNANPLSNGADLYIGEEILTNLVIGGSSTSIKKRLFVGCTSIETLTIGGSITSIGVYAFQNCTSLTSIEIPITVTSFGENAFQGCTSLNHVNITGSNVISTWMVRNFNSKYANPLSAGADLYVNGVLFDELNVPSGKTLGVRAFVGCTSIETVVFASGVTAVKAYALSQCTNLATVTIPESLTSYGENAFQGSGINAVYVPSLNYWLGRTFGTTGANPLSCGADLYIDGIILTDLVVPSDITTIKNRAFEGCTSIRTLNFAGNTTTINSYAFNGCSNLETITLPASITLLNSSCFANCTSMTDVDLQGSPATVNSYLFGPQSDSNSAMFKARFHVNSIEDFAQYNTTAIWKNNINYVVELREDAGAYTNTTGFYRTTGNLKINYIRQFNNTGWQALFVPFNIPFEDLEEHFVVASFNDEQDASENVMLTQIVGGTLNAGKPYLIKSKSVGEKTITATITRLRANNDMSLNPIVCGDCTFTGIYEEKVMNADGTEWAMSGGKICKPSKAGVILKPYRWYMTEVTSGEVKADNLMLSFVDTGIEEEELDENDVTRIENVNKAHQYNVWYTIDGQRITKPIKKGIYIKNGKKVLF